MNANCLGHLLNSQSLNQLIKNLGIRESPNRLITQSSLASVRIAWFLFR